MSSQSDILKLSGFIPLQLFNKSCNKFWFNTNIFKYLLLSYRLLQRYCCYTDTSSYGRIEL